MTKHITLKKAVLLVNLGTPTSPTPKAVRRFLRQFLSDPRVVELPRALWLPILYGIILPLRGRASAENYQKIWLEQGSPLLYHSQTLVDKLQARADQDTEIMLAMCYGEPSISAALDKLKRSSISELIVIPMYPQYSATTSGAVFDQIFNELRQWRWVPQLRLLNQYADHPLYIEALAKSVEKHFATHGQSDRLLMSFHGIPKRFFDAGDPYYCYCHKTARLLAQRLGLSDDRWQLVFQSRFGKEPWLQPYCDQTLQALPSIGVKSVAVVCPGFAADCLETLEEVAMTNRELFLAAGGERYHYIPSLNATDDHVQMFQALLKETTTRAQETRVVVEEVL